MLDHGYRWTLTPCWWKQKGAATLKKDPAVLPQFGVCMVHGHTIFVPGYTCQEHSHVGL